MNNNDAQAEKSLQERASAAEKVLVQGDLSGLNESERVSYYQRVCESLSLNPLTKPFDYIVLNKKLQLYAKKDCAEQLRRNYEISLTIVDRKELDGVYEVTARARMPSGRVDEDTGAVSVKGLQGEMLANARMKAVTKAKRRVTLSICGLGFLDEPEISSIPVTVADSATEPARLGHQPKQQASAEDGAELMAREKRREARLVAEKRCQPGELIAHLRQQAATLGRSGDIVNWSADTIKLASDWIRAFLAAHPAQPQTSGQHQPAPPQAASANLPTPSPAPMRYVTAERAKALQALCHRKGFGWADVGPGMRNSVCGCRSWPKTRMPEDLSELEYEQLMADLGSERDAEMPK